MALTNAEKQARHRAKQSGQIERLQAEVIALRAEVKRLRAGVRAETPVTVTVKSPIHGDRVWRRVGERDHTLGDGRKIRLGVWESTCVICGGPFQIESVRGMTGRVFAHTTCPAHHLTKRECGTIGGMRTLAVRRATFEAIKREKLGV